MGEIDMCRAAILASFPRVCVTDRLVEIILVPDLLVILEV